MLSLILIPALLAADADEALSQFKKAYRSPQVTERAAAVAELAKTDHKRVRTQLRKLLTADQPPVRMAAAKGLGAGQEDKKTAARFLAGAIRPNAKNPNVVIAIYEALGRLQEESIVSELHRGFQAREIAVAKSAVGASGKIRSKKSVPVLIELLRRMEEIEKKPRSEGLPAGGGLGGIPGGIGDGVGGKFPKVGKNIPGGVIEGQQDNSDRRRAQVVGAAIRVALQDICGTSNPDAAAWRAWWAKNGRSFKPAK